MAAHYLSKDVSFSKNMTDHTIRAIHQHPAHGYLCITGGGASGLSRLLAEPGASNTILGADIPYSSTMLSSQLGGMLSSACSEDTAAMMAAYALSALGDSQKDQKGPFSAWPARLHWLQSGPGVAKIVRSLPSRPKRLSSYEGFTSMDWHHAQIKRQCLPTCSFKH